MNGIATIWFLLISIFTGLLGVSLLFPVVRKLRGASAGTRALLLLLIGASAVLLFRPHEDTFTGLDTSCYRLMGRAFATGRGFHDVDPTLLSLPPDQRRAVLLEYEHWGRDTRDRSFEICSLTTCATRPYFYPALPLASAGLEKLTRIIRADYFVPLAGLLFFTVILLTGAAHGHKPGLVAAAALLIGTPLPAYFFRGYYAEAVGAVLVSLVLLGASFAIETLAFRLVSPVVLGFAIAFHPAVSVLALPALALLLASPSVSRRTALVMLGGFAVGLMPIAGSTLWICQPYGNILAAGSVLHNLKVDGVHRLLAVFLGGFGTAVGVLLLGPARFKRRLTETLTAVLRQRSGFMLMLVAATLPLLLAFAIGPVRPLVLAGLRDYLDGVRWSYSLILLCGVAAMFLPGQSPTARALLVLAVLVAPFFFYLKGFEQMGLWSQRRLVPLSLLLITVLAPALASLVGHGFRYRGPALALTALLAGAALVIPCRWPAAYWVRHEQGATDFVERVTAKAGSCFMLFDYYPFSVPFAATGPARAIGLSEYGTAAWPGLAAWLSALARREPVLFVTAYDNPGLEDGIVLSERSRESFSTTRVVSKTALPAEGRPRLFEMTLLTVEPATNSTRLAVHKILDGGPLAVRGPWGRQSPVRTPEGPLPARWSRQGSGLIGPVPPPGQPVVITLLAAASRDDGDDGQTLFIQPPWEGDPLALTVSNDLTRVSGQLNRPAASSPVLPPTGIYTLRAARPYDPSRTGIRGYDKDLGARIHSISIQSKD